MKFKVAPHSLVDKVVEITGPWEMKVEVDYDDVWHQQVDKDMKQLVKILNAHWKDNSKD